MRSNISNLVLNIIFVRYTDILKLLIKLLKCSTSNKVIIFNKIKKNVVVKRLCLRIHQKMQRMDRSFYEPCCLMVKLIGRLNDI